MIKIPPKTELDLILETWAFYQRNPDQRGLDNNGCPVYIADSGCRCAIGRLLAPEGDEVILDNPDFNLETLVREKVPLRADVAHLAGNLEFLIDLQNFHDHACNWDKNGLTADGRHNRWKLVNKYS